MIHPTDLAIGVLLGGALGLGLWCVVAAAPRWRARPLVERIALYVRDVTDPAGTSMPDRLVDPTAALAGGARAAWRAMQARFARAAGTSDTLEMRLAQSGDDRGASAFRGRQLAWAVAGAAGGALAVAALAASGRLAAPAVALPILGAVAGAIMCDALLTARAKARVARIQEELPTVLEFLALCLAAGEGVLGSVRRVSALGSGELTRELRAAVLEIDTGSPLPAALERMAQRLRAPLLTRTIDHVVAAIERGSPLAQTLEAQAADAREEAGRALIERAGRNEIAMMIPLVFGLLPLSVLFAIFPGIVMLRLGLG